MGYPVNPDGSFDYDHPLQVPTPPERIWHVDGILAPFDKSTTLGDSRVTYATTPTAAAEKVLTACRKMRGEDWGWVGQVRVYPHYAWTDPDCPVCKRRASKKYPEAIGALYEPVTITLHALTDEQAGYGEPPSQAALDTVERLEVYLATLAMADVQGEDAKTDLARWFDRFAQQAVAAREAEIVAALDEWRKPAIFGAEEARRKNRYDLKREFDLVAQAYDKAIETVRKM